MSNQDRQIQISDVFIMPCDGLEPNRSIATCSMVVAEAEDGCFYAYYRNVANDNLAKAVVFANNVLESANGIKRSYWSRLDTDWVKGSYPFNELSKR